MTNPERPRLLRRKTRQRHVRSADNGRDARSRRRQFADQFVTLRQRGLGIADAATQAAIHLGFAVSGAPARGRRLLEYPDVQEAINRRLHRQLERADVSAERVMRYWYDIATTELPLPPCGACRHCWGMDFNYQYTLDESRQALRKHTAEQLKKQPHLRRPFDERGGIGFDRTRPPNRDCPECHGVGRNYPLVIDRTKFTEAQRMAIDEVRIARDGSVTLKMRDRSRAMENLQELMGIIRPRKPLEVLDPQRPIEENVDIILQTAIDQGLITLDPRQPVIDVIPEPEPADDDAAGQLADIAAD